MPYSNSHSLTSPPSGFTVAFSVAVVCATADAAFDSTVGEVLTNTHAAADVLVVAGAADQRGVAFGGQRHACAEVAFADLARCR